MSEADALEEWSDEGLCEDGWLSYRKDVLPSSTKPKKKSRIKKPIRGSTVTVVCHCGKSFKTRKADLDRGWGLSCSKSCAATLRERNLKTRLRGDL